MRHPQRPSRRAVPTALCVAPALLACCLTACNPPNQRTRVGPIIAYTEDGQYLRHPSGDGAVPDRENQLIPDVPIPVGFKAVARNCSVTTNPDGTRSVTHYYQGLNTPRATARMYHDVLLTEGYGWQFTATEPDAEAAVDVQHFVKGPEALRVVIYDRDGVTTVRLDISPR